MVFIPFSHKKHVLHPLNRFRTRFNGLTPDQFYLCAIIKTMLILLSAALYSLFIHLFSSYLHLSFSYLLHFGGSSLACHSFPIWVTHTWRQPLIFHSTERTAEQPKAQHAGSCVSFSVLLALHLIISAGSDHHFQFSQSLSRHNKESKLHLCA